MAFDAHKNFAVSNVAVAPDPATSGLTLSVTAGEGGWFPDAPFNAVVRPSRADPTPLNAEVIRVTDRVGDVLTIIRAQETSSARAIAVGDRIYAGDTAKTFTDIESAAGGPSVHAEYNPVHTEVNPLPANSSGQRLAWGDYAFYESDAALEADLVDTVSDPLLPTVREDGLYTFMVQVSAMHLDVFYVPPPDGNASISLVIDGDSDTAVATNGTIDLTDAIDLLIYPNRYTALPSTSFSITRYCRAGATLYMTAKHDSSVPVIFQAALFVQKIEGGENGGSQPFDGARYFFNQIEAGVNISSNYTLGDGVGGFTNTFANFDTGNYAAGGFDGDGFSIDGYLVAPRDGYYRLSTTIELSFTGSDATKVQCVIFSPDGDGAWDPDAFLTMTPPSVGTALVHGKASLTYWLAEGQRVGLKVASVDGTAGTRPHPDGTLTIEYLGSGTNPAP